MEKELKNDKGPAGSEAVAGKESVSSTPNKGNEISAQPVVDGGECGVGFWTGNGSDIKFNKS
ncbi:MAG: hypothetical protein ACREQ5_06850 [Candidatus Dormibacteria bacterium]